MLKSKDKEVAIILCNLGGPRNINEVETFLLDLLGDPNVIQLPWFIKWFQKTLAKIIVKKRLPFSKKLYEDIGGKSPLVEITQIQAQSLENKTGIKTFVFMNCGRPNINNLKEELTKFNKENKDLQKIIFIPLFPQYSTTTTKTSIEQVQNLFEKSFPGISLNIIESYPKHPKFVESWIERIKNKLKTLPKETIILFSAHGIPKSYVDKGDPYYKEVKSSVDEIMKAFPSYQYQLCFQSRFGKSEWLKPYTDQYLEDVKPGTSVLIVPVSFVSDHVETIHEIGIEFKEIADRKGIKLYRVPGLNNSSTFIECLADLVQDRLKRV